MPKLNPEHQIKLNKKGLLGILANYGLRLLSFSIAKGGIENTTFLVNTNKGTYALRVYRKNKKSPKDILQELDFMIFLGKHKLPVPKVFPNLKGSLITQYKTIKTIWSCVLMQFMAGTHPTRYSMKLLTSMAITQARMHTLGTNFAKKQKRRPRFKSLLVDKLFITNIDFNKITLPRVQALLERAKKFTVRVNNTLPKGFNHLDYDHANVLVKHDSLSAILDFDDLKYSPIAVCLGYTMWDILFTNQSLKDMFVYLTLYAKHRKVNTKEIAALKDILLFRNYVIGALEIMFWGQNARYVNRFMKQEKILLDLRTQDFNKAL